MRQFSGRARLHKVALSNSDGKILMSVDGTKLGMSHITDTVSADTIEILSRRSSQFFAELECADLIKIDVEGYELDVLDGLAEHLQRLKPRAIHFEHFGSEALPDGRIAQMLPGYKIFGVKKHLTCLTLVPPTGRLTDYLAMRRD
jgi:hypothetical protein